MLPEGTKKLAEKLPEASVFGLFGTVEMLLVSQRRVTFRLEPKLYPYTVTLSPVTPQDGVKRM